MKSLSSCNREQSATCAHIWNKTVYSHLEKRTNKKNVGIFLRRIRLRHWFQPRVFVSITMAIVQLGQHMQSIYSLKANKCITY